MTNIVEEKQFAYSYIILKRKATDEYICPAESAS